MRSRRWIWRKARRDHIRSPIYVAYLFHSCRCLATHPLRGSARLRVCASRGREVNRMTFFSYLNALVAELRKREDGQTMAEYGVVLAVITLGVVVALGLLSGAISGAISSVIGFL